MRGPHERLALEKSHEDVKAAMRRFKRNPTPERAEQVRAAQARRRRLQHEATAEA